MTNRFAQSTSVSAEKSQEEIRSYLKKRGADRISYSWSKDQGDILAFSLNGRSIRFVLYTPDRKEFSKTEQGYARSTEATDKAVDQEYKRRWRVFLLILKAKFEAIDSGIVTFEEEFLASLCIGDKGTIGEALIPHIEQIQSGSFALLPPGE